MPDSLEKEIYQELIDWMRKAWWGLPESEHLMPTVQTFYNPEEAKLLTGIPFSGRSLEELAEMKGMAPEELAPRLDALARKAVVWRSEKGGTIRYSLNDSFFVFMRGPYWAEKPDEASKATTKPLNKYFYDGFMDQFREAHTKGLRTIPIERPLKIHARFFHTKTWLSSWIPKTIARFPSAHAASENSSIPIRRSATIP